MSPKLIRNKRADGDWSEQSSLASKDISESFSSNRSDYGIRKSNEALRMEHADDLSKRVNSIRHTTIYENKLRF